MPTHTHVFAPDSGPDWRTHIPRSRYSNCGECTDSGCAWCLSMPRTGKPACTLDKPRICSSKENHIGKANPNSEGCPVEEVELAEKEVGKSEL